MGELSKYTLGSGHLYVKTITDSELANVENMTFADGDILGRIKGGASFEYTTEKYEDEDDLGYIQISEITKEKVVLKSGVMTWNPSTLATLCSTARTETSGGVTTVKIGGLGNKTDGRYVICFEHYSHNLKVMIVGKNTEGFTFDFKQDNATVIDVQFSAEAMDDDGTLIIIKDSRGSTAVQGGSTNNTEG